MKGSTPLMAALAFGKFDTVEELLQAGVDPKQSNLFNQDALMLACFVGNASNVASWLSRFPNWDLERTDTLVGYTALFYAVALGASRSKLVRVLLEARANAQHIGYGGHTLLTAMAQKEICDLEVLELLLEAGCSVNKTCRPRSLGSASLYGSARLISCLSSGRLAAEFALLHGSTPLHLAAKRGDVNLVKALLERRALPLRNSQGRMPLEVAQSFFVLLPPVLEAALALPGEPRGPSCLSLCFHPKAFDSKAVPDD